MESFGGRPSSPYVWMICTGSRGEGPRTGKASEGCAGLWAELELLRGLLLLLLLLLGGTGGSASDGGGWWEHVESGQSLVPGGQPISLASIGVVDAPVASCGWSQ